jgi:hypothetical protein
MGGYNVFRLTKILVLYLFPTRSAIPEWAVTFSRLNFLERIVVPGTIAFAQEQDLLSIAGASFVLNCIEQRV